MGKGENLNFYKYQGTGNDFVLIDNRQEVFDGRNTPLIAKLCDRRFGIGADGLILLENDVAADFKMVYFNADGNESTMCGNGGRCIVAFAHFLGLIEDATSFNAIDGLHKAKIQGNEVTLWMNDVDSVRKRDLAYFLNTGSPHHVQLVSELEQLDVKKEGSRLRYGIYGKDGSNINFVAQAGDKFRLRTYERGVEDETLSCGTGATAVAIAMHHAKKTESQSINLLVEGGELTVAFDVEEDVYKNVRLIGPAHFVFKGTFSCAF